MSEFPNQYQDKFEDMMGYLNLLRESGVINMFGASPCIEEKFGIPRNDAREILVYWMEHFEEVSQLK